MLMDIVEPLEFRAVNPPDPVVDDQGRERLARVVFEDSHGYQTIVLTNGWRPLPQLLTRGNYYQVRVNQLTSRKGNPFSLLVSFTDTETGETYDLTAHKD